MTVIPSYYEDYSRHAEKPTPKHIDFNHRLMKSSDDSYRHIVNDYYRHEFDRMTITTDMTSDLKGNDDDYCCYVSGFDNDYYRHGLVFICHD